MELKELLGDDYEKEKKIVKEEGQDMVCQACGLAHITSKGQVCPVCFYEWFDSDTPEDIRERYFDKMAKIDVKEFFELKEKYQDEFDEKWKVKLQEDNFLWLVDRMEEVYKNL